MATSAGEVEVKLTLKADDFQKSLGQSKEQLNGFSDNARSFIGEIAGIFSFAAIADFFKKSIEAYDEQEIASARLVKALESQGRASDATVGHLEALSLQMEQLTGVEDNQIMTAEATLVTFGLQGQQMDRALKAALDLAAGMGIDLQQAVFLVGKAFQGQTETLGRYGIKVSEAIDPTQRFETVLSKINDRFGGQAQAQAETFGGQIKLMGDAFQHLQEAVGKFLAGEGGGLVKWLTTLINSVTTSLGIIQAARNQFQSIADFVKTYAVSILGTIVLTVLTVAEKIFSVIGLVQSTVQTAMIDLMRPIVGFIADLLSKIPGIGASIKAQVDLLFAGFVAGNQMLGTTGQAAATAIGAVKGKIEEVIVKIQSEKLQAAQAAGVVVGGEGEKQRAYHNTAQVHMDVEAAMTAFIEKQRMLDRDQFMAHNKEKEDAFVKFGQGFITTTADVWHTASNITDGFFQGFSHGMADMILQNRSFSDVVKQLWQDLARAVIEAITMMIAKWLAFLALKGVLSYFGGPAAGAALDSVNSYAGAEGAMASGGTIAEPSIITGLRSGRSILAGEAGPEAVVPMNTTNAETGGAGGSVTININGHFVEGDQASWQKLINEKIVPEIRRFTMSTPTGPFTRRRGVA